MPVSIKLSTPLRRYAGGAKVVEVSASTVGGALGALCERHPALREPLYDPTGEIRSFVRVFVGSRDIADMGGRDAPVADGDVLSIVPPVAGA